MTPWQLNKKVTNYIYKNKKMSPLVEQEYRFIKMIYQYLTRQQTGTEFREILYNEYAELMDVCYSINQETIQDEWIETVFNLMNIIIDREYSGPVTFIILNDSNHYNELKRTLRYLRYYNADRYYDYADFGEFYTVVDHFRKQFDNYPIDTQAAVGKYLRKDRTRFSREPRTHIHTTTKENK